MRPPEHPAPGDCAVWLPPDRGIANKARCVIPWQMRTNEIIMKCWAKGVVEGEDGSWLHFDHVPGEADVRTGCANVTGRVCVIGSKINEAAIAALFGV